MKRVLLIFMMAAFSIMIGWSQSVHPFSLSSGERTISVDAPLQSVEYVDDGLIVTIQFPSAKVVTSTDALFRWKIDGFHEIQEDGKPAVLLRNEMYYLPKGNEIDMRILETSYMDYHLVMAPSVGFRMWDDMQKKASISPYEGFFPTTPVVQKTSQYWRNYEVANISISPLLYDNENQIVRVYSLIKYKLSYNTEKFNLNKSFNTQGIGNDVEDLSFLNAMALSMIEDDNVVRVGATGPQSVVVPELLIITTPAMVSALTDYVNWKTALGYKTVIKSNDAWTSTSVNEVIKNEYKLNNKLKYLLILGDNNQIPSVLTRYSGQTYLSDYSYGCMDGENDLFPEIHRGRIPVSNVEDATKILTSIINYERGSSQNMNYYSSILNCAYFQDSWHDGMEDSRAVLTGEEIKDYLESYHGKKVTRSYMLSDDDVKPRYWSSTYGTGEAIPTDLIENSEVWDGNKEDIVNACKDGISLLGMICHGSERGWMSYDFTISDLENQVEIAGFPLVLSMSCSTGDFRSTSFFAGDFLKKSNGRPVGVFAPSASTPFGATEILEANFIDAIWPSPGLYPYNPKYSSTSIQPLSNGLAALGAILDQGLTRLDEMGLSQSQSLFMKQIFHCFGDPTLNYYSKFPSKYSRIKITRESEKINIEGFDSESIVHLINTFTKEIQSFRGPGSLSIWIEHPERVIVTITHSNKIPYMEAALPGTFPYIVK